MEQATQITKDRVEYLVEKIEEHLEMCKQTGTINQYSALIYYGLRLAEAVEKDPAYKKGVTSAQVEEG